jgi:hypothetical protein
VKLAHGPVDVLHSRQCFREAKVGQGIGRVELDDTPEHVDRFGVALLALQPGRVLVERGERVAREAELLIEIREQRSDVTVSLLEMRDVLRDEFANLLVDGDRLQREALRSVVLADPLVGRDGVPELRHFRLQIADLQESPSVVRILLDDLLVLRDRPVVLLLLDELLGVRLYPLAINRHGCVSLLLYSSRGARF